MMKCLSVKQPYASAIIFGLKDVENRTWTTQYRGRILIHSTKDLVSVFDIKDYKLFPLITDLNCNYNAERNIFKEPSKYYYTKDDDIIAARIFSPEEEMEEDFYLANGDGFEHSTILGEVDLIDVVTDSDSRWAVPGMYHWVLSNPQKCDLKIPQVRGRLRLWDFYP